MASAQQSPEQTSPEQQPNHGQKKDELWKYVVALIVIFAAVFFSLAIIRQLMNSLVTFIFDKGGIALGAVLLVALFLVIQYVEYRGKHPKGT